MARHDYPFECTVLGRTARTFTVDWSTDDKQIAATIHSVFNCEDRLECGITIENAEGIPETRWEDCPACQQREILKTNGSE